MNYFSFDQKIRNSKSVFEFQIDGACNESWIPPWVQQKIWETLRSAAGGQSRIGPGAE